MSKKRVTEVERDKATDFSFYLIAGSMAAAFVLLVVYVIVNL